MPSWRAWEAGCKRELLIWHRRAGKDDVCLHKAACAAHTRIGNYWHTLPMYSQARKAIWEAINPHSGIRRIEEAFPRDIVAGRNDTDMMVRFRNGSTFKLVGSDDPSSLVGSPPVGITFSEFALANPASWAYLAPILAENGGWASFITTPRGRNHVARMLEVARRDPWDGTKGWFSEILTPAETGFSLDLVEAQRREYHGIYGWDAGDALIEQEYWCSFEAAILGAYYGKLIAQAERNGRLTAIQADPVLPLHTAWDLGLGANMAVIIFQITGNEVRVLATVQGAHDEVIEDCIVKLHLWRSSRAPDCQWGFDYVPHDARVRELGTGKTRIETFLKLKRKPVLVPEHKVDDGIAQARLTLPQCWFNEPDCVDGLEALRQYRAEWDEDKRVFKNTPLHDWTSHYADAFRYLAMTWRAAKAEKPKTPERPKSFTEMSLNEMWKLHERGDRRDTRI